MTNGPSSELPKPAYQPTLARGSCIPTLRHNSPKGAATTQTFAFSVRTRLDGGKVDRFQLVFLPFGKADEDVKKQQEEDEGGGRKGKRGEKGNN